jgi:23S rRNA-/tRNA-specific pseudouridylate synthase
VDVDPKDNELWQHIDFTLEEKSAVTMWKALKYAKSLHAKDGILTMVELKPKTGRYHQLRRHMAWVCDSPIIGDGEYDGGTEYTMRFRERGLFLCSNRISLEHPFYNSKDGRPIWEALDEEAKYGKNIWLSEANRVMVSASIELPEKFENLLAREEERFYKFEGDEPSQ